MSDIVKMASEMFQIPVKTSAASRLPEEMLWSIVCAAAIKPDGYIGQAREGGVECTLAAGTTNYDTFQLPYTAAHNHSHFPKGCRHPDHEKTQLLHDFRQYRSINLALTCKKIYGYVALVFFGENGFELRDASDVLPFFDMVGRHSELVEKIRFYHELQFHEHHFHQLFGPDGIHQKRVYRIFEEYYLDDNEPVTNFVNALTYLKTCNNIKDFELVYRLDFPAQYFHVDRIDHVGFAPDGSYWFGEDMHWVVHVKGVLEKLRQDNGEYTNQVLAVRASSSMNGLAQAVGEAWGLENDFGFCVGLMRRGSLMQSTALS